MGLLQYFGDKFFIPLELTSSVVVGQVVWAPVPNLTTQPFVIEGSRTVSSSHDKAQIRWVTLNDKHFTRRDGKELPILHFRLQETEELIAFKGKRRPCIVVGEGCGVMDSELPAHHREQRLVVVPLYGAKSENDPNGFSMDLYRRIRYLFYPHFFPVPDWIDKRKETLISSGKSLKSGVARFDRLQFVNRAAPGCRPMPVRVSDDVLALMHFSLWSYLHAEPDEHLCEMRKLLQDCWTDDWSSSD